jgi:cobalt-zinc-cadmium efflux system protein
MGGGHSHAGGITHERPLWWALALTSTVLVVELVGGLLTNSLALLSDAAHMATDVAALAVSLAAVRLARRPADMRRSYGYARLEAIGAMVNGAMLFVVAGYILWEAVGRFRDPPAVATTGMLVIAAFGLAANLVSMRLLRAGSRSNLNVRGAYVEVWSDMLGSLGVIIGAVLIHFTGWSWLDPLVAVLIGLWILPRTWALLRDAGHILMEGTPAGLDLQAVRAALSGHAGVSNVHDLHAWALDSRRLVLTAHAVVDQAMDADRVRAELATMLEQQFHIHHVTLQIEHVHCGDDDLHP